MYPSGKAFALVAAFLVLLGVAPTLGANSVAASRAVIQRQFPSLASSITFEVIPAGDDGRDVYEYACTGGKLTVQGSSGVAMCRGVYDFLRDQNLGMVTWSGVQLNAPTKLPDVSQHRVVTPFQHRFYFNVVTYGYSLPYWTWERWQRELDWMALHGINLPVSFVATEAIGQRVFKQVGLTQSEMDAFYVGPAHSPWMRMGNVTGLDGPPPAGWNDEQIALQHKILDRMHELGIEPIAPAFAGFVPRAIRRIYPDVTLHESAWAGMPEKMHAFMLPPDSKTFAEIAKRYVQEWEKEFGKAKYFSADSFNEMELPTESRSVPEMLATYGRSQSDALSSGDPDAVWVLQGWMLGYQRQIWSPENLKAFLSRVPSDHMLILDEACDYNKVYWNNGYNYDHFEGFYGKPWVWGVIPNMGGKTASTGRLDFYASGLNEAMQSPNRGALSGMGFAPEGIENNEVLYELLADQAWHSGAVDLDVWLNNYCISRYGACPPAMTEAWQRLRESCYGTFTDHPRFGWQTASFGHGSVNRDPKFFEAVQKFLSCREALSGSPLYRADAVELAATALSLRAEDWFTLATQALNTGSAYKPAFDNAIQCLDDADRLLETHPLDRLQRWLDFARSHGSSATDKDYYEENARRIVTVWGPPINDYSARMWSGLIRDFYRPRMVQKFEAMRTGKSFDRAAWEEKWVHSHGVSSQPLMSDPIAFAQRQINTLIADVLPAPPARLSIGTWSPDQVTEEYAPLEWQISAQQIQKMSGIEFIYTAGAHRLDVQSVVILADGKEVARDEHSGYAGTPSDASIYRFKSLAGVSANNGCVIRAVVKGDGGHDSRGYLAAIAAPHS